VNAKGDPACDRHKNLQMIPTSFKTPAGRIFGHVCPVPSCGRHYDGRNYFDTPETSSAWERNTPNDWQVNDGDAFRLSECEGNG